MNSNQSIIFQDMLYTRSPSDCLEPYVPLQWRSAYIPSRRFSSSVTSRPLYDDDDHHSAAERTHPCVPLQLRLSGAQEQHSSLFLTHCTSGAVISSWA